MLTCKEMLRALSQLGLTQDEIANQLGTTRGAISLVACGATPGHKYRQALLTLLKETADRHQRDREAQAAVDSEVRSRLKDLGIDV